MTIKHRKNNVSAENEYILKDAIFNPQNMTLTITKKNLFTGENVESDVIKFNDFKLRVIKKTQNEINELKASTNADDIKLRETHLFLVPLDNSPLEDADEFQELIWSDTKNNFEKIGTTRIDLDPIQLDITRLKNILDFTTVQQNGQTVFKSNRLHNIETTLGSKANSSDLINLATKTELQDYVKSSNLATVATSGNYNDLSSLPTIPSLVDVVADGNQNAVTSNAVYDSLPRNVETLEIVYMNGTTRNIDVYIR